jgi:hypothetical protein
MLLARAIRVRHGALSSAMHDIDVLKPTGSGAPETGSASTILT